MRIRLLHALVATLAVAIIVGGFWQPHDPDAIDVLAKHASPSILHPLGTDHLGRDVASRMLVAGWRTALVVLAVWVIGFVGGALIGTVTAVVGGWREQTVLRGTEMFIVVPTLVWGLTAAAVFGLSPLTAGLALGLAGVGPYSLMANSLTHRALGLAYVQAARALGVGTFGLIIRHILPGTLPVLFAHAGAYAAQAVVAYAALAFIGLGADPTRPDWGSMLFEYRGFVFDNPWLMIWPGVAIALVASAMSYGLDPEK
jgi:peptide/nickel transport system permease protein